MSDNSFRRNVVTEPKHSSGKSNKKAYFEKINIPKGTSIPIIVIAGQHPDPERGGQPIQYYKFLKHVRKTTSQSGKMMIRDIVCSRGWDKHNPQPCRGCQRAQGGDKSLSEGKVTNAFTVVHLGLYHKHPLIGDDGKYKVRSDNGEVIMVDDEHDDANCNYCRILSGQQPVVQQGESFPMYNPQHIQTFLGRRRFVEAGHNHLQALMGWDKAIQEWCGTCRSKLTPAALTCSHCNAVLMDLAANPMNQQQLDEVSKNQYPCTACGQRVFLNLNSTCHACTQAGRQMQVNGLFDVVCYCEKTGEGTASTLQRNQHFTVEEFEASMPPQIKALLGGKSLREYIKGLSEQYKFEELLAPLSLEEQDERLGYTQQGGQQGFQQPGMPQQPQQGFYGPPGMQQPQQPQMPAAPPAYGAYPQPQYPQPQMGQPQQPQQGMPGPAPFAVPPKPNFGS
jgi:hypothetical protein